MTREAIDSAACRIFLMGFFPSSDENLRATIIEVLGSMCSSDEQVIWLSKHFTAAYMNWPGLGELRAFYCWCYKPADGIDAYSVIFPDGIPRHFFGNPPGRPPLGSGGFSSYKMLSEGQAQISADPELNALVTSTSADLPTMARIRTKEEIEADLYQLKPVAERKEIKPSKPGSITQADFDALASPHPKQ